MSHVLHLRMLNFLLRLDPIFRFTPLARQERKALKVLHGFSEKIILDRREELLRNGGNETEGDDDDDIGLKRKKGFLDILLASSMDGRPLSNKDIREEVDTFMFEGHDTTTSGITFCLFNIAKHPVVQEKCFQEIRTVLGEDPLVSPSLQQLGDLHYLDLVIKETLRLFPSVPLIGRTLHEDLTLGKCGTIFVCRQQ